MLNRTPLLPAIAEGCASAEILRRAGGLPHHDSFPDVDGLLARFDDLERAHPHLVRSRRFATSSRGEAIRVYSVGSGAKNHLIAAGVHPNEPIGNLSAIFLAESLVGDPDLLSSFDATWHIVPNIDPDGARLNETWYASPSDRSFYAEHLFRPAPSEQVEWAFPASYKEWYFDSVLPETLGLMRLLEELRPTLYVSLHNSEMGGAYYYLTKEVPELTDILHAIPDHFGVPLDTGEPESGSLEAMAPGIFRAGTIAEHYDYDESLGLDPIAHVHGASSTEYADRYGTFSLIVEVPFWGHPSANDNSPINETYSALLLRTGDDLRASGIALGDLLASADAQLTLDTPFLRASRAFVPGIVATADSQRARAALPASDRAATVAERFGTEDRVTMFRLRYGGMLLRALRAEVAAGTASVHLRRISDQLQALMEQWRRDAATGEAAAATVIPISSLVGVQFGAILAVASHLEKFGARQ